MTKSKDIISEAYTLIEKANYDKILEENENLKKIIAKELSENDEFGSEFVLVNILKDKNAELNSQLETEKKRNMSLLQTLNDGLWRLVHGDKSVKEIMDQWAKEDRNAKDEFLPSEEKKRGY